MRVNDLERSERGMEMPTDVEHPTPSLGYYYEKPKNGLSGLE